MSTLEERRIGAVVGALVADAAGKYLFLTRPISKTGQRFIISWNPNSMHYTVMSI